MRLNEPLVRNLDLNKVLGWLLAPQLRLFGANGLAFLSELVLRPGALGLPCRGIDAPDLIVQRRADR